MPTKAEVKAAAKAVKEKIDLWQMYPTPEEIARAALEAAERVRADERDDPEALAVAMKAIKDGHVELKPSEDKVTLVDMGRVGSWFETHYFYKGRKIITRYKGNDALERWEFEQAELRKAGVPESALLPDLSSVNRPAEHPPANQEE